MDVQQVQKSLNTAQQVYAVGPRPLATRAIAKTVSNFVKIGLLAVVSAVVWNVATPDTAQVVTESKTAAVSDAAFATPASSPQSSAEIVSPLPTPHSAASSVQHPSFADVRSGVSHAPAPSAPNAAYPLPIAVTHKDTAPSLAVKMWRAGQEFQAAAIQAEGLETAPYYIEGDSTQPTIGVGYNIKMSATAIGQAGVRTELKKAGIADPTIAALLSPDQKISAQARINIPQALALLDIATHRFRASTRAAIGASTFDRLPAHRQAALMWIDYNSNLHNRDDIVAAVRQGQTQQAIERMETWITVHGKKIISPNIVLAQSMYWSEDGLKQAVMNPSQVKRNALANALPWQTPAAPENTPNTMMAAQNTPLEPATHTRPNDPTVVRATAGTEVGAAAPMAMNANALARFRNVRSVSGNQPQPLSAENLRPHNQHGNASTTDQSGRSNELSVGAKEAIAERRAWLERNGYKVIDPQPAARTP